MWDVFKGIAAPIKSIFDSLGGFIKVAVVFIKIKTAQTLWNAVTMRSAALLDLASINTGKYVLATEVATARLQLLNTETGLQVVGLKALIIKYRLAGANLKMYNTSMAQSAKAAQLARTQTMGLGVAMKKLDKPFLQKDLGAAYELGQLTPTLKQRMESRMEKCEEALGMAYIGLQKFKADNKEIEARKQAKQAWANRDQNQDLMQQAIQAGYGDEAMSWTNEQWMSFHSYGYP